MYGETSRERNLNLIHNSFREQSSSPKIENYQFTKESAVGLLSGYSSVQGIKKQLVSSLPDARTSTLNVFLHPTVLWIPVRTIGYDINLGQTCQEHIKRVSCLKGRVSYNKTQGIRKIQSEKREVSQGTSQKSVWKDANCPKCGKTRVAQPPLVLNLHLIG